MLNNYDSLILKKREYCAICGSIRLDVAIDLPTLPLTGIYSEEKMREPIRGIDQRLLLCNDCGHAQLAGQVKPSLIYNDRYSFRTSLSATARDGTDFFLSMLGEIAPGRHFNCVFDIGCNDLYLLKQLEGQARVRVGIDPLWASKENQQDNKDIIVIGSTIEDINIDAALEYPPDLIVCRHTLEHIYEPTAVLKKVFDMAAKEALFLFEVPGFEPLVRRFRFDQVFHQHLQYFTLSSFLRLIEEVGGIYISSRENYHHWGALLVAFAKGDGTRREYKRRVSPLFRLPTIHQRYAIFKRQLSTSNDMLRSFEGTTIFGYGAAQMVPVLAYHLGNDLLFLEAILDDDPMKDGLYYWNLPIVIRHVGHFNDLKAASILITALDNVKPILNKLLAHRPRHILYPFPII